MIELSRQERWKEWATRSLGKTGSDSAVPHLVDWLRAEDYRTRADAAEALGNLGAIAADAIPALRQAIDDPDLEVCARAVEALGRIGSAALPALVAAMGEADDFTLGWIAHALGEVGDGAATPVLQKLLSHRNTTIRYFAAEALKKVG